MAFFWSDRILTKVHAESRYILLTYIHTPKKYIKNTIRNRFEIRDLFLLVEQNRALYFFRPGKIQGKIQLLMAPGNGSKQASYLAPVRRFSLGAPESRTGPSVRVGFFTTRQPSNRAWVLLVGSANKIINRAPEPRTGA